MHVRGRYSHVNVDCLRKPSIAYNLVELLSSTIVTRCDRFKTDTRYNSAGEHVLELSATHRGQARE